MVLIHEYVQSLDSCETGQCDMDPVLYQVYTDTDCCLTPANMYIIRWQSWHIRIRLIDAMDSSNWQLLFVAVYNPCRFPIKYPTNI